MCDDSGIISTGTAFFFVFSGRWFLITNWHNISGKHFLTKEPLSSSGRFPTYIKAKISRYLSRGEKQEKNTFTTVAERINIYADFKPVWFEHPDIGSNCDIVAVPFERPDSCPEFMHNAANFISDIRIPIEPGNTVFIIGFPQSISVGFGLPVWKSGYIASEPHYPITLDGELADIGGMQKGIQLPAFFIDSQTREGMSGAPIFSSYIGAWDTKEPYAKIDWTSPGFWSRDDVVLSGRGIEFIGCYSGRVGRKEEGASLGLCWGVKTIEQVCQSRKVGTHPHVEFST